MPDPAPAPRPYAFALAGLIALAVAMGIGRFAFTPLLPMMMAEGSVSIAVASLLASANYLGYLVGALVCTFQPWLWHRAGWRSGVDGPRLVRWGLVATCLLTLGMALPAPALWPAMRFGAGVASAVVFLYTSGWCLEQLARRGVPAMGALIYTGPGAGIFVSGLAASGLVAAGLPAMAGWVAFAALAAVLTVVAWPVFDRRLAHPGTAGQAGQTAGSEAALSGTGDMAVLSLAYGLAGLGYIVTATFLPVIARAALPGSPWPDLFWPLVGVGVMAGALAASRLPNDGNQRLRLAACYGIQAAGVAAGVVAPTLAGFAVGSLLLGLPFTAITFFAMQEVRRIRPGAPTSAMGLLTAVYGVGQIAGPPIAAWLVARSPTPARGFDIALWVATGALLLGAALYLATARSARPQAAG